MTTTLEFPLPCSTLTIQEEHIQTEVDSVPLLFIGTASSGVLYLVVFADELNTPHGREKHWLATPITEQIRDMVLTNKLDLYTAFHRSATGNCYAFRLQNKQGGYRMTTHLRVDQVLDSWLPLPGIFWRDQE